MARLSHTNETGIGLPKAQLRAGIAVEKEHTKDEGVARQIAIDHLKELPDYYTRLAKMEKAAAYKLQDRITFRGLEISIENKKGSRRYWYDPHGKEKGSTLMHADYGYIRGTEGTDGDHVDVYVGPNEAAAKVYVIDQMKKPDFKEFDEQKVMLGFGSAKDAKELYLKQYNDPRFFGSMKEMDFEEFAMKVLDRKNHGEKVSRLEQRRAALVAEQRLMGKGPSILGGYPMKEASEDPRVEQRAEHLDDLGLSILAAPSLAHLGQKGLDAIAKVKNPRMAPIAQGAAALGKGLRPVTHFLEEHPLGHHGVEVAGLAMVSPTITKAIARHTIPAAQPAEEPKVAGIFKEIAANPANVLSQMAKRRGAPYSPVAGEHFRRQLARDGVEGAKDVMRINVKALPRAGAPAIPGLGKTSAYMKLSDAVTSAAQAALSTLGKRVGRVVPKARVPRAPKAAPQSILNRGMSEALSPANIPGPVAAPVRAAPGPSPIDQAAARSARKARSAPSALRAAPDMSKVDLAGLPGSNPQWQRVQAPAPSPSQHWHGQAYKPQQTYTRGPDQVLGGAVPAGGATSGTVVTPGRAPISPQGATAPVGRAPRAQRELLTPGRLAKGAIVGVGGLGLYGGYRAIDAAANLVNPAYAHASQGPEPMYGPGRVF